MESCKITFQDSQRFSKLKIPQNSSSPLEFTEKNNEKIGETRDIKIITINSSDCINLGLTHFRKHIVPRLMINSQWSEFIYTPPTFKIYRAYCRSNKTTISNKTCDPRDPRSVNKHGWERKRKSLISRLFKFTSTPGDCLSPFTGVSAIEEINAV